MFAPRDMEVKTIMVYKSSFTVLHDSLDESINWDVRLELSVLYIMLLGLLMFSARK